MKFFKIKALCLAVTAAALFIFCFGLAHTESNTADSTTAYNLSSWLAKHNVMIDKDLIDVSTQNIVYISLKSTASDRSRMAEALLGGEPVSLGAETYSGPNGTVVFAHDTFTLTAASGLFSRELAGIDKYNTGKRAENTARSLGFDLNGSVISANADGGKFSARITKTIESKPVFDDCILLTMDRYGLISASGVWYTPDKGKSGGRRAKPAADALAELLDKVGGSERVTVRSMTLGYRMKRSGDTAELEPVWRFELEDRDDIYIDA